MGIAFWIFMAAFGWSCRNLEGGQYSGPFTIAAIFCVWQAIGSAGVSIPGFTSNSLQQWQQQPPQQQYQYQTLEQQP